MIESYLASARLPSADKVTTKEDLEMQLNKLTHKISQSMEGKADKTAVQIMMQVLALSLYRYLEYTLSYSLILYVYYLQTRFLNLSLLLTLSNLFFLLFLQLTITKG